jgi:hypothetical protein
MSVSTINWHPDDRTLGQFSEIALFVLGMVLAPLALWRGHETGAVALWSLAVLLRLAGLVRPRWLRPVFLGLSLATWPIGWVVSHTALALVYALVFTPVALAFRLIGRDAMQRKWDRAAASYWEPYRPDRGLRRYLRQY